MARGSDLGKFIGDISSKEEVQLKTDFLEILTDDDSKENRKTRLKDLFSNPPYSDPPYSYSGISDSDLEALVDAYDNFSSQLGITIKY